MVTVHGCIQQIPPTNSGGHELEIRDLEQTADSYLDAVDQVEANIPDGWRLLYVRTLDQPSATQSPAQPPTGNDHQNNHAGDNAGTHHPGAPG